MITIRPVRGLPEITAGSDLAALIAAAAGELADGDIVIVTSKVVAKAEGRVQEAADREDAISAETVRVVARRGPLRIVQTRHGLVLAAAGVDASNVAPGQVVLLPLDPDESAHRLRAELTARTSARIAVVITDTVGRPWRQGLIDIAIGVAGLDPLIDLRGGTDGYGRTLDATVIAVADELAAATDLVKGKVAGVPVAVVGGLGRLVTGSDGPGARALIRPPDEDMFRLGTADAVRAAVADRRSAVEFAARSVPAEVIDAAIAGASTESAGFVRVGSAPPEVPAMVAACVRGPMDRVGGLLAVGAAIADLQFLLAAEQIGSSWRLLDPAHPPALDGLPIGWEPVGLLAIGHPTEQRG